jgi:excisionase family DNA binding protein
MADRAQLAAIVGGDLLEAIEAFVNERVTEAVAELVPRSNGEAAWLTLEQAGERLGCTADAVRMRVKRGRLTAKRQGRRVYVSRESVDGA